MYKTYKLRIYPNSNQEIYLNKLFSSYRYIYNYCLNKIKQGYSISYINNNIENELIRKYKFLNTSNICILKQAISQLKANIKKSNTPNLQSAKFKSKSMKIVIPIKSSDIQINKNKIAIKPLDIGYLKYRGYNKLGVIILNATIVKYCSKYYVHILSKEKDKTKVFPQSIVGVDVGIKHLLTLSDGTVIKNNKYIDTYQYKISALQKNYQKKRKTATTIINV